MSKLNREEIIKLIKDNFPLDLISFEYDIPMETLEEFKNFIDGKEIKQKEIVEVEKTKYEIEKIEDARHERNLSTKKRKKSKIKMLEEEKIDNQINSIVSDLFEEINYIICNEMSLEKRAKRLVQIRKKS